MHKKFLMELITVRHRKSKTLGPKQTLKSKRERFQTTLMQAFGNKGSTAGRKSGCCADLLDLVWTKLKNKTADV